MVLNGHAEELRPVEFLQAPSSRTQDGVGPGSAALIILNQPIADLDLLHRLWFHSTYRICADGGANQLHDLFEGRDEGLRDQYLPSAIHGDLDSLRNDVRKYYESRDVPISRDPDQYSTDFGKAIKRVLKVQPSLTDVLVLGTIAGRLDQGLGLLSEFYREQCCRNPTEHLKLWLFSECSISFILPKGTTRIETPMSTKLITENIGILPVYGQSKITTEGLEWDVEDWPTSMGDQVSTSNHIKMDRLVIKTETEVLFTMERRKG